MSFVVCRLERRWIPACAGMTAAAELAAPPASPTQARPTCSRRPPCITSSSTPASKPVTIAPSRAMSAQPPACRSATWRSSPAASRSTSTARRSAALPPDSCRVEASPPWTPASCALRSAKRAPTNARAMIRSIAASALAAAGRARNSATRWRAKDVGRCTAPPWRPARIDARLQRRRHRAIMVPG